MAKARTAVPAPTARLALTLTHAARSLPLTLHPIVALVAARTKTPTMVESGSRTTDESYQASRRSIALGAGHGASLCTSRSKERRSRPRRSEHF